MITNIRFYLFIIKGSHRFPQLLLSSLPCARVWTLQKVQNDGMCALKGAVCLLVGVTVRLL